MSTAPLPKRLGIKPGFRVRVLAPPEGYLDQLAPLPADAEIVPKGTGPFDLVQLFVTSKADVDRQAGKVIAMLRPRGLLWIAYPKKTSKVKTDISRDHGWEAVGQAGWIGVSIIAIDETWSALRFRPREHVGT
jgi:hypothetical protein